MKIIQSSFSRGEIAPSLHGRVDIRQYQTGLATARNMIVHQHGGISNRPGTLFIGPVKDHTRNPRLLPFQFKTTDTHIIEFGHEYIRIIRNDGHVTESVKTITAITGDSPGVITSVGHGYVDGDEVFLTGIVGMTELNGQRFTVNQLTVDTFSLLDQVTGVAIDTTSFTPYSSGGTAARIFTLTTDYQQEDLRRVKFVQTADVMTLVHPDYPVRELSRLAVNNWTLTDVVFRPTVAFPIGLVTSGGSGGVDAFYTVTAIDQGGNESLQGINNTTKVITGATNADPVVITAVAHGFSNGDLVHIKNVGGMTEINDRRFTVANKTTDTFELLGEDGTDYGVYTSGGDTEQTFVFNTNDTAVTISWTAVTDAVRYRIFKKSQGVFGFIGSTEGVSFTDPGSITPDLSDSPPRLFEPFLGDDNQPGAVGFHQQRMVFGGSNNEPDTTYFSVVGDFHNFTHSIPFQDDDSFSTTLASSQINDIRHYVSAAKDMLVLTSGSEWSFQGSGGDARFTISTIEQIPQTNLGANHMPPIVIDSTVLFTSLIGNKVMATAFALEDDHYVGKELSILVPHMFRNREVVEWAYIDTFDPTIYLVRDDGKLLTCAFNEKEDVNGWTVWDTEGKFESVAEIRPTVDAVAEQVYFVVKRKINGNTVRYIERTHDREFEVVQDCFFVDCGLSLDSPITISNIASGVITATTHGLSNGDTVDLSDIVWASEFDEVDNETNPDILNGRRYLVSNATTNNFMLNDTNGVPVDFSGWPVYVEGGVARKAVLTISGLFHLKNEAVAVLADGNVVSGLVVDENGNLVLPRRFSRVHIGLPYFSDMETLNPEFKTSGGNETSQGRRVKTSFVNVRFERTRGLWIGPDKHHLTEMKQRQYENIGAPTELLTGDKEIQIETTWNTGRLFLRQRYPLPMTVLQLVSDVEFGEGH